MAKFFSRPNRFFPRSLTVAALVVFFIPLQSEAGFRYLASGWLLLLPWFLHALDVTFGIDDRSGGNVDGNGDGGDDGGGGGAD